MVDIKRKNIVWNIIGSSIISIISLCLMIIITRINGLHDSGIFSLTFSIACILYVLGVYYGRTYQVTEENISNAQFLNNRFFTCILMITLTLPISFLFHFDLYKSIMLILLTIYKSLEALSESLYAMMQKENKLYIVGILMTFKTIISIISFFIIDIITNNLIMSIISMNIVYILFICLLDVKYIKDLKLEKFSFDYNKRLLKMGFTTFIFTALSIYLVNSPKYAIGLLDDDLQGVFGIIIMPATVMSLISQFIINPYVNELKDHLNNKEYKKFKNTVFKMIGIIFCIISFCAIIASIIGIPFLQYIYNVELSDYYFAFMIIMIGSIFYGIYTFISYVMIIMRKTLSQMIILIITCIISIILSAFLINRYGILGASILYLLLMFITFLIYIIILIYIFKKYQEKE